MQNDAPHQTHIQQAFELFTLFLPAYWKVIEGREGFHLFCFSRGDRNIQKQREVFANFSGEVEVFVHNKCMSAQFHQDILKDLGQPVPLSSASVKDFVDRNVKVVLLVKGLEICAGADKENFQFLWAADDTGFVDLNPCAESRYDKTFRAHGCLLLVPVRTWSCVECKRAGKRLSERFKNHCYDEGV